MRHGRWVRMWDGAQLINDGNGIPRRAEASRSLWWPPLVGVLLACVLASACPATAPATTLPAACSGTTGDTSSLISAINTANALTGPDTVVLGAGCTYTLATVDNYWYGPNGLPAIAGDVTIEGNGATIARSGSAPAFRLFFVASDTASSSYVSPALGRRAAVG